MVPLRPLAHPWRHPPCLALGLRSRNREPRVQALASEGGHAPGHKAEPRIKLPSHSGHMIVQRRTCHHSPHAGTVERNPARLRLFSPHSLSL